jgi:hypothetical protein
VRGARRGAKCRSNAARIKRLRANLKQLRGALQAQRAARGFFGAANAEKC